MLRAALVVLLTSLPAFAGDLADKYEMSVFGGVASRVPSSGADGTFGGNFGYGLNSRTVLFVEAANNAGGFDYVDVHAGLKRTLLTRGRFEPYVLGGLGVAHANPIFGSSNGLSLNAGFGARVYLGQRWGVQPEFRWMHFFDRNDVNLLRTTGGIFFQWGR